MGKELVISSNRHETKVAVLEDEQLVEVYFQRSNEYSLAGSIHKGRVTRVLPGMQSAFVDIGLERDAFLYVSDFFEETDEYDRIPIGADERAASVESATTGTEPRAAAAPATLAPTERPAGAAPPAERGEESERDRRERRTRRPRRRRTRGHGFPESKYAPEVETLRPAPEPGPREFPILPGESLAKYRSAAAEQTPEAEVPQAGEQPAAENADAPLEPALGPELLAEETIGEPVDERPAEEDLAAGAVAPEELEEEETPAAESAHDEQPGAEVPDTADDAQPDAEASETPAEEQSEAEEPVEWPDAEAEADSAAAEAEVEEPTHFEPGIEEETAPAGAEEAESAEAAAEPAEPEAGAEERAAQPETAGEPAAQREDIEPARMPVSLTATLREQGYRYMHRASRRMRRKLRGAAMQEGRVEEAERRAEAAPEAAKPETKTAARPDRPPQPSITELLREGQEILVQIAKEPLGQKGARITSHIALPGRYVVYMPTVDHQGVSRKIASDEERGRLKRILQRHRAGIPGGFIIRTAGEGKSEQDIASDMQFLYNLWLDIRQKAESRPAPTLIHHDLDLVSRTLRDQLTENFKTIWTDNEEVYESALRFVQRFQPTMVSRVKMYTRPTPIFDAFNVSSELEKALRPKVWLKSGGYIVINQTEALVAIDVNTGKFVGKSNRLEDTIVKTNTEAVKEIVRQIRLRDLGGIIVIDFIDMDERKNRQKVMQALEEAIRADRAPNKILQFNDFGLVAITRKRVKQSLERTLCAPCPYCDGAGYVKSVQTVIGEILQEAHKIARAVEGRDVMLRVNPEVAKVLKSPENDYLEELEEVLKRPVMVTSDATLQQEKFDLA